METNLHGDVLVTGKYLETNFNLTMEKGNSFTIGNNFVWLCESWDVIVCDNLFKQKFKEA